MEGIRERVNAVLEIKDVRNGIRKRINSISGKMIVFQKLRQSLMPLTVSVFGILEEFGLEKEEAPREFQESLRRLQIWIREATGEKALENEMGVVQGELARANARLALAKRELVEYIGGDLYRSLEEALEA